MRLRCGTILMAADVACAMRAESVAGGIARGDGIGDSIRRYTGRILTDREVMHVR